MKDPTLKKDSTPNPLKFSINTEHDGIPSSLPQFCNSKHWATASSPEMKSTVSFLEAE